MEPAADGERREDSMNYYELATGRKYELTEEIVSQGTAQSSVWNAGQGLAAVIYHSGVVDENPALESHITDLIEHRPACADKMAIAWPTMALVDEEENYAGYIMPQLPSDINLTRFLRYTDDNSAAPVEECVAIAIALCRMETALERDGYAMGAVETADIGVRRKDRQPVLYAVDTVVTAAGQGNAALETILYRLLMNGCKPTDTREQPLRPNLEGYAPDLRALLQQTATAGHTPATAAQWEHALLAHQKALTHCKVNPRHAYYKGATECPYCAAAQRYQAQKAGSGSTTEAAGTAGTVGGAGAQANTLGQDAANAQAAGAEAQTSNARGQGETRQQTRTATSEAQTSASGRRSQERKERKTREKKKKTSLPGVLVRAFVVAFAVYGAALLWNRACELHDERAAADAAVETVASEENAALVENDNMDIETADAEAASSLTTEEAAAARAEREVTTSSTAQDPEAIPETLAQYVSYNVQTYSTEDTPYTSAMQFSLGYQWFDVSNAYVKYWLHSRYDTLTFTCYPVESSFSTSAEVVLYVTNADTGEILESVTMNYASNPTEITVDVRGVDTIAIIEPYTTSSAYTLYSVIADATATTADGEQTTLTYAEQRGTRPTNPYAEDAINLASMDQTEHSGGNAGTFGSILLNRDGHLYVWESGIRLSASSYGEEYMVYHLDGQYNTLSFDITPNTNDNFHDENVVQFQIIDESTGDVLYSLSVDINTPITTVTVPIDGIRYLRLSATNLASTEVGQMLLPNIYVYNVTD